MKDDKKVPQTSAGDPVLEVVGADLAAGVANPIVTYPERLPLFEQVNVALHEAQRTLTSLMNSVYAERRMVLEGGITYGATSLAEALSAFQSAETAVSDAVTAVLDAADKK